MSRHALRLFVLPAACAMVGGLMAWADAEEGKESSGNGAAASASSDPRAVSGQTPPSAANLAEFSDPAFARYVDVYAAGRALLDGDAAALTDAALALAEGERVLLRQHKGLSV